MIPNIRKNRRVIIVTFAILGMALANANTATFKPLFLLINLNGLETLKILMILILPTKGVSDSTENIIITKSSIFQGFLK